MVSMQCRITNHLCVSNIGTLLKCPLGFVQKSMQHCDCHPALVKRGIKCQYLENGSGCFLSTNMWVGITTPGNELMVGECPYNYCNVTNMCVNPQQGSDVRCALNRAGKLCGSCQEGHSLSLGSNGCAECPNNNNLALLIVYAAAGFIIVFFIATLNLTVTQGAINGLIIYSNIFWFYKSIWFPREPEGLFIALKPFFAWLNLNFGFDMCLLQGMNNLWKIILLLGFPFYMWSIAGVIIITAKYSSKFTNVLGNRAVPTLSTLFFLSYMRLLGDITSIFAYSQLDVYNSEGYVRTLTVWRAEGSLCYFEWPHVLLFIIGTTVLLLLFTPYTLILFSAQWLRKWSHLKMFRWVKRLNPIFDAYFAPIKNKHHYWFGVLLITQALQLITRYTLSANMCLLVLLITMTLLLVYTAIMQPYKRTATHFLQCSFLANLIILSGGVLYANVSESNENQVKNIFVSLSSGVCFVEFCGIVISSLISSCFRCILKTEKGPKREQDQDVTSPSVQLRDSILETSPLITN